MATTQPTEPDATAPEEPQPEVQLVLDAHAFARVRQDPAFHRVLTLARIVNTIRFNEVAIVTCGEIGTPSATRQSSSATFYLGAILWEALRFADRLGEHFRDSPAFRERMVPLLKDSAVRELRAGLLDRLRNQAVYHHDDAVIPEGLELVGDGATVLLSAMGGTRRDAYYDLADIAVMQFALGGSPDVNQFAERGTAALNAVVTTALRFASAADYLIKEYAQRTGWRLRSGPRTPPLVHLTSQATPSTRTEQRGLTVHLTPTPSCTRGGAPGSGR